MFFLLPPIINFIALSIPLLIWSIYDYIGFYYISDYKELRSKYIKYFRYRALSPRNPGIIIYISQISWAFFMFIPV